MAPVSRAASAAQAAAFDPFGGASFVAVKPAAPAFDFDAPAPAPVRQPSASYDFFSQPAPQQQPSFAPPIPAAAPLLQAAPVPVMQYPAQPAAFLQPQPLQQPQPMQQPQQTAPQPVPVAKPAPTPSKWDTLGGLVDLGGIAKNDSQQARAQVPAMGAQSSFTGLDGFTKGGAANVLQTCWTSPL